MPVTRIRLAIVSIAIVALAATGCSSHPLPPPLSPANLELVQQTHFDVVVGVDSGDLPTGYASRLVTSLEATGLFAEVRLLDQVEGDPDLIATVTRPIYGTASLLPVLTVATLGLIPTWGEEEWGEAFALTRPGLDGRPIEIELSYSGNTVLGWVAIPLNISPNRQLRTPRSSERFDRALAAEIVARSDDIRALLDEETTVSATALRAPKPDASAASS